MRKNFNWPVQPLDFCLDERRSSVCSRSNVMLQKSMFSIDQGCRIASLKSGVNAIKLYTVEYCWAHCIIISKLKVSSYHFEISPDAQHDLRSETTLFGDLYRRFGGLNPYILSVGGVTIKYSLHLIVSSSNSTPETTIHMISNCLLRCWSIVISWGNSRRHRLFTTMIVD